MAVSGSTDFSVDRDTLIKATFRLLGLTASGVDPTAQELTDAAQTLNMMLKAWQAKGLQLWQKRSTSVTLVASDNAYTLGPAGQVVVGRPLRVFQVVRRDSDSNDVPLTRLSQSEYWELSNKTTSGAPTTYFYDPQLTSGVLYVWPTPAAADATEYTLQVVYHKPFDDMDASTNDFEFPQEWYEVIKYGLAVRLATEYGVPVEQRRELKSEFRELMSEITEFDQEDSSVFFQPERY